MRLMILLCCSICAGCSSWRETIGSLNWDALRTTAVYQNETYIDGFTKQCVYARASDGVIFTRIISNSYICPGAITVN